MSVCLIGLGSNLGDRRRMLDQSVGQLARHPLVKVAAQSPWLETLPVGGPVGQSAYLNGALVAETSLEPERLLELLHHIEASLGRRREQRWGPRPIDLDLLLYDRVVRQTPALVLPHPRMTWRRFVLEPAVLVDGGMVHPLSGWTVRQHLEHLSTSAPYVALSGPIGDQKAALAQQIAARSGARWIAEPLGPGPMEAFYADPAGQGRRRALEFLRQWPPLLSLDWPGWSVAGAGAVSDFWFEEALAFAQVWLPPPQQKEYDVLWQRARATVATPRLIVLLPSPGFREERRFGQAILDLAIRPGRGPLLRLDGDDSETDLAEVLAAMEAMR